MMHYQMTLLDKMMINHRETALHLTTCGQSHPLLPRNRATAISTGSE